jgi:hypothetical protein
LPSLLLPAKTAASWDAPTAAGGLGLGFSAHEGTNDGEK